MKTEDVCDEDCLVVVVFFVVVYVVLVVVNDDDSVEDDDDYNDDWLSPNDYNYGYNDDFLTQWDLHRQRKREEPLQPGLQSPKKTKDFFFKVCSDLNKNT